MLHKYQETSWTYPASEKITFDNYKDQPYAFNKTIETQNVLTPFNPLEPNSVSYANKDGLPYDRIIKADPLKSVYHFDNVEKGFTIETKTNPTYGTGNYQTFHGAWIKKGADMEYDRIKDPINRTVREQQIKDKYAIYPIEYFNKVEEKPQIIEKIVDRSNKSTDINDDIKIYSPKNEISELSTGYYAKTSDNGNDIYRMENEINPLKELPKRGKKRFSNIDNDFNNNLPLYLQNKDMVNLPSQRYEIKENKYDKHTNKLLENNKNGLNQDLYTYDENAIPLRTMETNKFNKEKGKDNKTFTEENENLREPFKNDKMISDNESRNLIYMNMLDNAKKINVEAFDPLSGAAMTREEMFYNTISAHPTHRDFMEKFDMIPRGGAQTQKEIQRTYLNYQPTIKTPSYEEFVAPRNNYEAANVLTMNQVPELMTDGGGINDNLDNSTGYRKRGYEIITPYNPTERTLYEFQDINANSGYDEHIPLNEDEDEQETETEAFERIWDNITHPFTPSFGKQTREGFIKGNSNISTGLNTYLALLQSQATALITFVKNNPDYKPWSKYWGYLERNINKCNNLYEILDRDSSDVAYVQNKGEHMRFRVRDKDRFIPSRIYTYVLIHEMAHLANGEEWGHGPKFQMLMHLLEVAAYTINILQPDKFPTYDWESNGTPILNKDSIKTELIDGVRFLKEYGGNAKFYNDLLNNIQKK